MLQRCFRNPLALGDRKGRVLTGGAEHDHSIGAVVFEVGHLFLVDALVELEILVAGSCGGHPKQALAVYGRAATGRRSCVSRRACGGDGWCAVCWLWSRSVPARCS